MNNSQEKNLGFKIYGEEGLEFYVCHAKGKIHGSETEVERNKYLLYLPVVALGCPLMDETGIR
jgi:hypothetical protein